MPSYKKYFIDLIIFYLKKFFETNLEFN